MEKIDIINTLKDGWQKGIKNVLPLLLMVILYLITIWIPYLNVGTTVGFYKAIVRIGKGEQIDPLSIFNRANYAYFGDYFLLSGLTTMGTCAALAFMFVPAVILALAWSFATFFLVDKGVSPLKALGLSYKATLGEKWRIFAILLIFCLALTLVTCILSLIPAVGGLLAFLAVIFCSAIMTAVLSVMYNHFSAKADALLAKPE